MIYGGAVAGVVIILIVLADAFEAIVLPRRVARRVRLTRFFYLNTWIPFSAVMRRMAQGKRREALLSYFGPLSLLLLLCLWAVLMIFGFALVQQAFTAHLEAPEQGIRFTTYLYLSGVTFFTLGFGDVTPLDSMGRVVAVIEAGTGFGSLAIVIGYLPVIYQSYSKREVNISLLDARAGSPPSATELLRRTCGETITNDLDALLRDWEKWAAELLESHLSYPVLCYYRSQHDNQSWLAALTTVLDTCALVLVGIEGTHRRQARLTFAITRHAVVDLAHAFKRSPRAPSEDRLPPAEMKRMRDLLAEEEIPLRAGADADQRLRELRETYEPYVNILGELFLIPLPTWTPHEEARDNWQLISQAHKAPREQATNKKAAEEEAHPLDNHS